MGGFRQLQPVAPCRQRITATGRFALGLARRQRPASQGFIAVVMLVLLTLILGSLAMVARTSSGRVASSAQGRNREARDVAEAGVTEIISELNKEPNRKLLVSGVALANWSQGTADLSNPLVNPCTRYNSTGGAGTITTPTARAIALKNGWINLVSGDGSRSYRLVSVSYSNAARTQALTAPLSSEVTSGQVKALLRLTVEGRVSDAAGNAISTTRVVKEFEVVPKCCKRSFGRNSFAATVYGEDNRFCYSGGGLSNISEAVAAVVGGLNGGTINSSNNILSIYDNSTPPQPVTRVLCRSDVPSPPGPNAGCEAGTMTLGRISVVPSRFDVPVPPWPGDSSISFTNLQASDKNGLYLRVNPTTNSVEKCNLNNSNLSSCASMPACTQISGVANYVSGYYCRISEIKADKGSVIFDTSNAPIFVYMDSPSSPTSNRNNYMSYQGNGLIQQVRCAAGTTGVCANVATINEGERLSIYAYGAGSISLNGADAAVTMNVFAPHGSFTIKGGGSAPYNFIGRLWLNNIYANGSTVMQVLESAPAQMVAQGSCTASGCAGIGPSAGSSSATSGTPEVDWVARSVTYSSAF